MTAGTVNANAFWGTSRTRYLCNLQPPMSGVFDQRKLNNDGSMDCQSPWSESDAYTTLDACPNLINLSTTTEANWVDFSADLIDIEIHNSKGKLRLLGQSSFKYITGDASGIDARRATL